MKNIVVSVIMPAYNSRQYIREAVESVFRQKVPFELVIVDDCSEDRFEEALGDYLSYDNVKLIRNKVNMGVSASRNIGVQAARGQYVAYLDADDIWADGKLTKQIIAIKDGRWAICHTARELIDHNGNFIRRVIPTENEVDYSSLLMHNCIACSSVLMPRDIALDIPMEHDDCHEDYLTWLKVLKKYGRAIGLNEPLLIYRLSEGGKSRNKLRSMRMTYRVHRYMGEGLAESLMHTGCHLAHGLKKYGMPLKSLIEKNRN